MVSKRKAINLSILISLFLILILSVYFFLPRMFADEVYPLNYSDWIKQYSEKYSVDPALVAAVILQESRFNPKAVSPVGAQGLMQFMPGTASTMAKETGRWPNYDIFDPETSIEFGAAHIRDLLIKYNGNVDQALAGYNAGTGTVDRWLNANIFEKIIGSNSNSETVKYVRKVKNYQTVYQTMYAEELGLKPAVEFASQSRESDDAQVRGLIWYQIFNNILSFDFWK